ncbi:acyl carrier protein [Trinickia caryophylli]|uniref:Phosphopantetheine attachment site n=1 Tax=Trinickia caryophylli TaxID=28094 RepID=A0A1X7GHX7_TRICW|nr:acyl carrier protein [Trinickia caryophylli]PMS09855.1 acyl carrier protein [Trinickia caryophylli]TRX14891.1 acyl carrier protein [Trinickia caryophylli]WQE14740.1 acyl carrier protein [Trinickia caryophylli]SMF70042.1 Phosphopantetheine attachment site [Trinickia caryophylli]GLU34936.1 hypothetical protein Busp01_47780 [Trinickia caryophylli]
MDTLTANHDIALDDTRLASMHTIWQQLLGQDDFSDDQEFFELGGDSVLLIGMLELVRQTFDKEIAVEDLAEGITVRRLVNLLG